MYNRNNNGFTLVELLATLVILAVILVIAVPKVMSIIEVTRISTLESTARLVALSAEKKKIENEIMGNDEVLTCENVVKINDIDYKECYIEFIDNKAVVTIIGTGTFKGMNVCDATKNNVNITEKCLNKKVEVILELNGGNAKDITGIYKEGTILELEEPIKENSTFTLYEIVKGNSILIDKKLTVGSEDTIVYAMYESWPTLEIDLDGGNDNINYNEKYKSGSIIELEIPTKTGYTFIGWKVESGNGVLSGNTLTMGSENTKVKAVWQVKEFNLTIQLNNGTTSQQFEEKYFATTEIILQEPTRKGYTFSRWDIISGVGTINGNVFIMGFDDIVLEAIWEPTVYEITFNENVTPSLKKIKYDDEYGELPVPTKTGHTFAGWSFNQNSDEFIAANTIMKTDKNHTLYANWDVKNYTIKFHSNGGVGNMSDQIIKYDAVVPLHENIFIRNGYKFLGWSLSSNGEKIYNDKERVLNLKTEGVVNLYAIWGQNTHTVTFDYNGGIGTVSQIDVSSGKAYGELPNYPSNGDKLFMGWYTEKSGGTRVYSNTIVNSSEDHILYAHWEESASNVVLEELLVKNAPDLNNDGVMDSINLNFKCASSFEKYNIPLNNLVVGQKYRLKFNASNNATFGTSESGYKNSMYGSIITKEVNLSAGSIKEEAILDGGLIAEWNDHTKGNVWLNGPFYKEMIFTAEASTMYWSWDFGLMTDYVLYNFNFTNIELEPVVPKINFNNKNLVLYTGSKAQVIDDVSTAYSTNFKFDGDSYAETLYYSITDLIPNATYTITFEHKFNGSLIDDSSKTNNLRYEYGCGIMDSIPTTYASFMSDIGTWASNTFVMKSVNNNTQTVTLTFTAKSNTAYWVWNMANCSDSVNNLIDVKIKKFSAKHSNGGSITYYNIE